MSSGEKTRGARLLKARLDLALATTGDDGTDEKADSLPSYVQFALARLRLLHDMPFRYLVPDSRLLPVESARFFTLDDAWLDKLVEGALSGAGNGTRELARAGDAAEAAIASSTRLRFGVRKVALGRAEFDIAVGQDMDVGPGTVSGLLIRSMLVSRWPKLSVRAWSTADTQLIPHGVDPAELERTQPHLVVPILRLERLSPSVLLALFEGVPSMLWLEEPHGAVQFGVERGMLGGNDRVDICDEQGQDTGDFVQVSYRDGVADGVVDIQDLARKIDLRRPLGQQRGSAGLALQLLRRPTRQRFES